MEKILFCILISVLSAASSTGQNSSFMIYDGAGKTKAYLATNNVISAMVENESCDSVLLFSDNGEISRNSNNRCEYIWRPTEYRRSKLKLFLIEQGDTILLKSQMIKITPWPFTALFNGNYREKTLSISSLENACLSVESLNTGLSSFGKIKSFHFSIERDCRSIHQYTFLTSDPKWKSTLKNQLKTVKSGDIIAFTKIEYIYAGLENLGFNLNANDLKFKIN